MVGGSVVSAGREGRRRLAREHLMQLSIVILDVTLSVVRILGQGLG